jgi:uncharacterized protein involved in exopolysaccharide biosynthesis
MTMSNPAAAGRMPRSPGAKGASETALTPREALGMLRRHLWLILFVTLIGGAAGTGGWYLVRRYLPLYRAETAIKVLPPIVTDPMDIVVAQVQQDVRYGHRVALANLMKSQSTLQGFCKGTNSGRNGTARRPTAGWMSPRRSSAWTGI